ncbi:SSV1 integrase-like protein, N-fragment [Thermococcus gammatolerans EJ3]|uniref:SSV1 integrase-like protein, N-fragment n=1 Tax=Thermococcus gammatolerans (strain DSM 15229 / JCM 11827 / EJ3) TaxID=593117 RepID=C5A3K6_THEGJ|nr:SSV1 integrase-like protein, N-fragment [Thermococcus gammatolerans EJ3]
MEEGRSFPQPFPEAVAKFCQKRFLWWTGRDLNPRPPPCEGGARTRLSYRPTPAYSGD